MRTAPSMYEYELDVTVNDNMAGRLIGALVGATGREADGFTHIKYELYKILDGDGQPTEHWPVANMSRLQPSHQMPAASTPPPHRARTPAGLCRVGGRPDLCHHGAL
jgi:hypothetical protein